MNRLFFIIVFTVISLPIIANNYRITGKVVAETDSTALSGTTVIFIHSEKEKGTTTDQQGVFIIDKVPNTSGILQISHIGYENYIIQIQDIKENLQLGTIYLKESAETLSDVIVTAENISFRSDKMIVYPQSIQVKHSGNVFDLMQKQGLPNLEVNRIEQRMSINGRSPQYRINGVPKTAEDILTIQPKDILRIDYSDMITARYADKNTGGVIDFILKERTEGGVFSLPLSASPMTGFINASPYFAYHWDKTEIALQYYTNWRDYSKRVTNEKEAYIGEDFRMERELQGEESPFEYWNNGINATYVYQPNTSTNFTAVLRNEFGNQHNTVDGMMYETESFFQHSKSSYKSYMPSLDLFFSKKWKGNRSLEINIVGSLLDSEYGYILKEERNEKTEDYFYNVDNSRHTLISELSYTKGFEKSTLNVGLQNTLSHTDNKYREGNEKEDLLKQNNNYLYASWSGKTGNLSWTIGTGIKAYFVENNNDKRDFIRNQSSLSISYPLSKKLNLSYQFQYRPILPTLSQLSSASQRYDSYLIMTGNPELKTEQRLLNQLRLNLRDKHWIGYLTFSYNRISNPIFNDVSYLGNSLFISEYMNYDRSNHINTEMRLGYNGILNHFNIRGTLGYNHYNTKSDHFSHHLNNVYWSLLGEIYFGKWELSAYYLKPQKQLIGESIITAENNADIRLSYRPKNNLSLMLICMYPFSGKGSKYHTENLATDNPSQKQIYIKDNANMLLLQMNYTLNFGKSLKKSRRNLNNRDTESGILKLQE